MIRKIGESFPILANFHANETPLSGGGGDIRTACDQHRGTGTFNHTYQSPLKGQFNKHTPLKGYLREKRSL